MAQILFVAAAAAWPGLADVIVPDGTFHEFLALNLGGPAEGCGVNCLPSVNPAGIHYSVAPPWTFNGPAILLVLDLFLSGDQYEVFDNGVSLGLTSTPGAELQCGLPDVADIACSLATPNFSRRYFTMGAGSHSITINYVVTTSVLHSGAALQLAEATPEPATAALVLAGIVWLERRRRSGERGRIHRRIHG